jgi:Domain of unknown function (DUF4915)
MADHNKNILVSLCNFEDLNEPQLFLLDRDNWNIKPLPLKDGMSKGLGVTGLAASDEYIFAATQLTEDTSGELAFASRYLMVLDKKSLHVESRYLFERARDVHAICRHNDGLLVTSSGTDELLFLNIHGPNVISEEVWWRLDHTAPLDDIHHLNGVCSAFGRVIVCGFGRRTGATWDSAQDGFLYDITQKTFLARGLKQPHSVSFVGSDIFFCESRPMLVHKLGSPTTVKLNGYTRGLCFAGDRLYAASSTGRTRSRSTGKVIKNSGQQEPASDECAIWELDGNLQFLRKIPLSSDSTEIFDLLQL